MNPFILILSNLIYRPIFNLLIVFLTISGGNLWISIIALTLTIRLALLKTSLAQNQMQQQMTDIQPKIQEIQDKYKDDPEKMSAEMMKVLKTQWAWPLKWCLVTLIQIPVFLGLFYVIKDFSLNKVTSDSLYSFFNFFWNKFLETASIDHYLFWLDLLHGWNNATLILAIIWWELVYLQMKLTMLNKPATPSLPWNAQMPDMNKMMGFMNIMMVLMMWTFIYQMPAWIGIYILTTTLFGIAQFGWQYRELLKVKLWLFHKK